MCRARHERPPDGRRCPGCSDPARRAIAAIRQRIGRYDRAARAASDLGDYDRLLHYADLLDRDVTLLAQQPPPADPPPPSTRAAEFTTASTDDWTDQQLVDQVMELDHDPDAQAALLDILEWRDQVRQKAAADLSAYEADQQRMAEERAAQELAERENLSPLTNPAQRTTRRLTADQQCREEYDQYVYEQYLDAEDECRGNLLSREGLSARIDAESLFSGPASRAEKYASVELQNWWAAHGRVTYAEWKFQSMGRASDRLAAQSARQNSWRVGIDA